MNKINKIYKYLNNIIKYVNVININIVNYVVIMI